MHLDESVCASLYNPKVVSPVLRVQSLRKQVCTGVRRDPRGDSCCPPPCPGQVDCPGRRNWPLQGHRRPHAVWRGVDEVRLSSVFRAPDRWQWVWLPVALLLRNTPSLSQGLGHGTVRDLLGGGSST